MKDLLTDAFGAVCLFGSCYGALFLAHVFGG